MALRAVAFRFDPFIWEGVGIIERTGEDSNGEPVYSPTEFGIKFIDATKTIPKRNLIRQSNA